MHILVVNDDGYTSVGLKLLADAFRKNGQVTVVAPHYGQSGASSSITVTKGLKVYKHHDDLYSVEGTPSDCVKYALYGLKLDVDLVVSGVNNGLNIGIDTIYSGTIGAAMEALFHGKKALAFSTDVQHWGIVEKEIDDVIQFLFTNHLMSHNYVLNVNFPGKNYDKTNGILITDLGIRQFDIEFEEEDDIHTSTRTFRPFQLQEHTDLWAYKHGYTSITPLKLGNGDKIMTQKLRELIAKG